MFRAYFSCFVFLALAVGGAQAAPPHDPPDGGFPLFPGADLLVTTAGELRPAAVRLPASLEIDSPGRSVEHGIWTAKHGLPWRDAGFGDFNRLEIFTTGGRHALTVWPFELESLPPRRMEPGVYFVRIAGTVGSTMRLLLVQ